MKNAVIRIRHQASLEDYAGPSSWGSGMTRSKALAYEFRDIQHAVRWAKINLTQYKWKDLIFETVKQ